MTDGWDARVAMTAALRATHDPVLDRIEFDRRIERLRRERVWALQAFPLPIVASHALSAQRFSWPWRMGKVLQRWLMHPVIQWEAGRAHV